MPRRRWGSQAVFWEWGIKKYTPGDNFPVLSLSGLQRFMLECYRCAGIKMKALHAAPHTQLGDPPSLSVPLPSAPSPTFHPFAAGCSSSEGAS